MIFSCFIKIVFTLPNSKIEQSAKKLFVCRCFKVQELITCEMKIQVVTQKLVNSGEFAQRSYVLSTLRRRNLKIQLSFTVRSTVHTNQWGKNFWKTLLFFYFREVKNEDRLPGSSSFPVWIELRCSPYVEHILEMIAN